MQFGYNFVNILFKNSLLYFYPLFLIIFLPLIKRMKKVNIFHSLHTILPIVHNHIIISLIIQRTSI